MNFRYLLKWFVSAEVQDKERPTRSALLQSFSRTLLYSTTAQSLLTRGSSPRATRSTRTSRRSSPSRRPCGALLSFGEFLSYLYFASAVSDIYVINVINNIRIRFIMSYSWYVLWYIVHSVVYTCDLILARIWLLGLCSFINRVLQSGIKAISTVGRSLDRTCRVLGLSSLQSLSAETILLLYPLTSMTFYPSCLDFSLKNSFRRLWPESVIWPPWVWDSRVGC